MKENLLQQGFAIIADNQGRIIEVVKDGIGLDWLTPGQTFTQFIDPGSRKKFLSFLAEVNSNQAIIDWEINIKHKDQIETLRFAGVSENDKLFIVAARNTSEVMVLFDETMKINITQSNALRGELIKQVENSKTQIEKDDAFYNEISYLNNELVSLQREMAKKNSELETLYGNVRKLAITDPLTGIFNRRGFFEIAKTEVERAKRYGHPLSAIIFDFDDFKMVNDTYGHMTGDIVLKKMASRCSPLIRNVDIFCRFGGEEFAILLPETNLQNAEIVAERLRQAAKKPLETGNKTIEISISLGIAALTEEIKDLDQLLRNADSALYEAKLAGRDCIFVYRPG